MFKNQQSEGFLGVGGQGEAKPVRLNWEQAPYGRLFCGKIRLPKLEHPKSEGQLVMNEDKY